MLVIASKSWTNFVNDFSASKVYLKEVVFLSLGLLVSTSLIFCLSVYQLISASVIIIVISLIALKTIGRKRRIEIERIKEIIQSIRNNAFEGADEIDLGRDLGELGDEIRSMFIATQNNIANLKKLEQVRTEFLGNVSHELRTPIFAIQGYLETLINGAIDDSKVNKSFLNKAIHHTNNLNNLLNDLIDISMIESGQMRMSFRYFNIGEYIENIVNEMRIQAEEKNLSLELKPVRKNLQLFGDKTRLKQVFTNLISNSIKYTDKGKIEIDVLEEDKFGTIVISDTGIGISENDKNRIFERFYRVDKDRSRAVGGTGLGLAIVKHIIEAHGSKVYVESQLGKGTKFFFKLKK